MVMESCFLQLEPCGHNAHEETDTTWNVFASNWARQGFSGLPLRVSSVVRRTCPSFPSMKAVFPLKGCECTGFASSMISIPMISQPSTCRRWSQHSVKVSK